MLDKILELKNGENSLKEFSECICQGIPSAVFGVPDSFKSYLISSINYPTVFVVKDSILARVYKKEIEQYTNKKVVYLPFKDDLLLISKAFSKETLYERLCALSQIKNSDVIILTAESLLAPCPKTVLCVTLSKDDELERDTFIKKLIEFGYVRQDVALAKGTFSVRGDVVDVFPINHNQPLRIDFFGDFIDNIKRYDLESRNNLGNINSVTIIQASEFTFLGEDKKALIEKLKSELSSCPKTAKDRLGEVVGDIILALENDDQDVLSNIVPLLQNTCSIFELISKESVFVFDEAKRGYETASFYEKEFTERFKSLYNAGEVFSFSREALYGLDFIKEEVKRFRVSALQTLSTLVPYFNPLKIINPKVSAVSDYHLNFTEVYNDLNNWLYSGYRICIFADNVNRAQRFCGDLSEKGIASVIGGEEFLGVNILPCSLSRGFIFHEEKAVILGSGNLFTTSIQKKLNRPKRQTFFSAPEVGDYCVHEIHGVGRVLGSKKITTSEGTKDYISVEYFGGDVLHVPVEQMDILTRYLGGDKSPKLSKIGGKDFEKIKASIKESIKKLSIDLKKLYSERESLKGYKFSEETELQQAFNNAFEFEETPDQLLAEADIMSDMTSGKVMDRLICGDVGFGKTEVAFRAVFRTIANGKQVAMLAPTTILCEQHFNTAVKRFKDFGIRIACLNRFKTARQQKAIIEAVKNGQIDFVIGTHRLLSKDIGFFDLGLLVLDEEQRFGVEHKEKIKLLRKNVNTLTLTATPIPRTLHMSLSGIRAISTINTPPKKRLPVQTYVTEQTDFLIKDAIIREINREGQVFILYNRVESIFSFADYVKGLVPETKIVVAHGQMDERELEKNIMRFYNAECNVLISTTIIENGIDLPKANTLIVIDADKLGLSSLYQLKGRVGRSDRLAYAYFTFKREKVLTDTAYERLSAITDFAEMGSGIKIAMRDLEIRGAGNILGAQQHGHMDKIGYELYSKLLREEISGEEEVMPELDIRVNAYIPDKYIESNVSRMDAYKQIAEISSPQLESEFIEYAEETFGKLPLEVINLISIAVVKRLASSLGVSKINVTKDDVSLIFSSFKSFSNKKLVEAIESYDEKIVISMENQPKIKFVINDNGNSAMLFNVRRFLTEATK